ncbi:MAG: methyltransferase domain-containing protein [Rickettsiales bacterium]|jgi:SAM-dependent methyltransferase|nr:methyltransferase domain-containing protein [Rickettsiales bacterium]
MPDIFDQKALIHKRNLVAKSKSNQNHFLLEYIFQNITERFDSFSAQFDNILLIGVMSEELVYFLANKAKEKFVICDLSNKLLQNYPQYSKALIKSEAITTEHKFDLVYSFLDLHHINNIPRYLTSIKNLLNHDGVFMANFFGEENLKQLRQIFFDANAKKTSPHFFPYIDIKSAAHLLQKTGFKEPISDIDRINITYAKLSQLCQDIKAIAETNILSKRSNFLINKNFIAQAEAKLLKEKLEFEVQLQIINVTCYATNQ